MSAHRLHSLADENQLFDADANKLICGQAMVPWSLGNIADDALLISIEEFNNSQVIVATIRTKMFFESTNGPGSGRGK